MATCFNCGGELCWDSDFMKSEFYGADYDEEDDSVVNMLHCPHCHAEVLVIHPSETQLMEESEEEDLSQLIEDEKDQIKMLKERGPKPVIPEFDEVFGNKLK